MKNKINKNIYYVSGRGEREEIFSNLRTAINLVMLRADGKGVTKERLKYYKDNLIAKPFALKIYNVEKAFETSNVFDFGHQTIRKEVVHQNLEHLFNEKK